MKGKKVCVFGLGVSGLAAAQLLVHLGSQVQVVDQGSPSSWKNFPKLQELGEGDFLPHCHSQEDPKTKGVLGEADLIILSPGIPLDHPVLAEANQKKIPIWSEIELGFQFVEDLPLVAVTGTNGKTTTVTLMGELFERAGFPVFVGGNIGIPFCQFALERLKGEEAIPAEGVILEVSSFQLETIHRFHPRVAVITNIELNHEERYLDLQSYAEAKFRITSNMGKGDFLIYPEKNVLIQSWAEEEAGSQGITLHPFNRETVVKELAGRFAMKDFALLGAHNWENLYCAQLALELLGKSREEVNKAVGQVLREFKGVSHRLERVHHLQQDQWQVFNDAKSTNLLATATAVRTLREEYSPSPSHPLHLIFGGKKRDDHLDWGEQWEQSFAGVSKIYLIGETTDILLERFRGKIPAVACHNLEGVMKEWGKDLGKGEGILLFSPGFPSFDQFQNYAHRGDSFKALFPGISDREEAPSIGYPS